eukprot:m.126498 g.126498  ORF g.126498 m.126498 type:complete len:193 (-) comp12994_c3_seq3:3073-3651(-)
MFGRTRAPSCDECRSEHLQSLSSPKRRCEVNFQRRTSFKQNRFVLSATDLEMRRLISTVATKPTPSNSNDDGDNSSSSNLQIYNGPIKLRRQSSYLMIDEDEEEEEEEEVVDEQIDTEENKGENELQSNAQCNTKGIQGCSSALDLSSMLLLLKLEKERKRSKKEKKKKKKGLHSKKKNSSRKKKVKTNKVV